MTEDQLKIRSEALKEFANQLGLNKEDLLKCIELRNKIKEDIAHIESISELTEWAKKNFFKYSSNSGIDFNKMINFVRLDRIATNYEVEIKNVDGKVKFGVMKKN